MWKQKIRELNTVKIVRLLQLFFVFATLWFIYWAHVYEITVLKKTFLESVRSSLMNVVFYWMSIVALLLLEIDVKHLSRTTSGYPSPKTFGDSQKENELLKRELRQSNQIHSSKIGVGFLVIGAVTLFVSVVAHHTILAFIGLGLTFWGGTFLFARPIKFVRSTVLNSTTISSYVTLDRMIQDLHYKGRPIYVPPCPKQAYIPEYLEGLEEMIVYVPARDTVAIPTVEEMVKEQFLLKNPRGMCIAPPGHGLTTLLEKELRSEFTRMNLEGLCSSLPTIIVRNLELAKEFEITAENDLIHVKLVEPIFKELYSGERDLKSIRSIGCPLTSAIACALAKTTAKLVTLVKDDVSPDLRTIEVWYKTLEV